LKKKLLNISNRLKNIYKKIQANLLNYKNRKKYLTMTGILIFFNVLLINTYFSYGYYYINDSLSLLKAKVGNMYNSFDYVLLVYKEDVKTSGNGSGKYLITESIPTFGYNYSGYRCQNGSILIFDEETKKASVTPIKKEVCSIYFDAIDGMDIAVKVMLEDDVGSSKYISSSSIPSYGYKFSYYKCKNNSSIDYNSEKHTIKISANSKEECNIYFTKERADISLRLYVEENYQTEDYIERVSIPSNNIYTLNKIKSYCENQKNERVETTITYKDGYINLGVEEISSCKIYLDKNEE